MNDIFYFIITLFLTIFMLFYGGHNSHKKIVYDSQYFLIGKRTDYLKKCVHDSFNINNININSNNNYIYDITENFLKIGNVPNCFSTYIINIKSKKYIDIGDIKTINNIDKNVYLMVKIYHI